MNCCFNTCSIILLEAIQFDPDHKIYMVIKNKVLFDQRGGKLSETVYLLIAFGNGVLHSQD